MAVLFVWKLVMLAELAFSSFLLKDSLVCVRNTVARRGQHAGVRCPLLRVSQAQVFRLAAGAFIYRTFAAPHFQEYCVTVLC